MARSNTGAEYDSLALATTEAIWVQSLLSDLAVSHYMPVNYCNNLSMVALVLIQFYMQEPSILSWKWFLLENQAKLPKQNPHIHVLAVDQRDDILTKYISPSPRLINLFIDQSEFELRGY